MTHRSWMVMGLLAVGAALAGIAATGGRTAFVFRLSGENGISAQREADSSKAHIVFVIGEKEYNTRQTLPAFAEQELEPRGLRCTFIFADPNAPNVFPGLEEALQEADLLFLSVRRRTPPAEQLAAIRQYLEAGNPLVTMRTSSHAFALREGHPPPGHSIWPDFDVEVLGGRYENHYGTRGRTEVFIRPQAASHPILRHVRLPAWHSSGTLYKSRSLAPTTEVLLRGRTTHEGHLVNEPVAWTNTYHGGRVFYTSLGHPEDFQQEPFRRLLTNAVLWALGREVPGAAGRMAGNAQVAQYMESFEGRGELGSETDFTSPQEALKEFEVPGDIAIELVASEPIITQPVEIKFDARGRLWVVQYNQYPYPEGLEIVGYDYHLRAEYDKVPPPPPERTFGADVITMLEDTDEDGTFDKATDVITGLSITTSVALGRGGIWVLNPPYLLEYPDPDGDGIPNGKPEVHLRGFGLQDTHAVANSLTWGPDGWLYGAQGSTTISTVSSAVTKNVHFKGQAIWRYHPETKEFELFAEGGGNTFNVAFDAKGRLYSGHNGGNARAFHYKQGAYYLKNWGKHGALTNPYAFGYFDHMKHTGYSDRFTHAEIIYEDDALPDRYDGKLISVNPLQNRIVVSRLELGGSTFETIDTEHLVTTGDEWFRPVDIRVGPDAAVYVADWYDDRLSHVYPRDTWHRASGRIYRIAGEDAGPVEPFDLTKRSTDELIELLSRPNRWFRWQALRILGDREDRSAIPKLKKLVKENAGPLALEALWALNLSGGFNEAFAPVGLEHADPYVRMWTVRLLGDAKDVSPEIARSLAQMARTEPNAQVRSQLAASAKRLPAADALPIIRALLFREEDADDAHIPLQLWWALEDKAAPDRQAVLAMFEDPRFWEQPIVEEVVLERLMQRYVIAGGKENLSAAAHLLELSPSEEHTRVLITGLEKALQASEMDIAGMPPNLIEALQQYQERIGRSGLALELRQGKEKAVDKVLKVIADEQTNVSRRLEYIRILGQIHQSQAIPVLLEMLEESGPTSVGIQRAALQALTRYDSPEIGERITTLYPDELRADPNVRAAALELLASRKAWAVKLLEAVGKNRIDASEIPVSLVQRMQLYDEPKINRLINEQWPEVKANTSAEERARIERIRRILSSGQGHPRAGKSVFMSTCGACHKLFGEGGTLGPALTGYDRNNTTYMVLNIVDPSASVREGYVNYVVRTEDGRTLTGFISNRSGGAVTLRSLSDQETTVPEDQIVEMRALSTSIMPEGLLEPLSSQEIRDLFAYLQSKEPPADTE